MRYLKREMIKMDLWIMSQNKTELMKVVDFDIYDAGEPKTYVIESRGIILGNYKTQQRALEVLDEIYTKLHNIDSPKFLSEVSDISKQVYISPLITYEMPKE
jgi:hypothetical protein